MLQLRNWWTSSSIGGRISGLLRTIAAIAVIGIGAWLLVKGTPRALAYFQNDSKDSVTTPVEVADTATQVDSTPAIVLKPARKDCDVSDSTQTFCSSDPQIVSISDKGELHLKDTGTVRICSRKPIASITYTVVPNYMLTFTSSLDIENPRCDKFVVTKAGQ